jgi:hypothetical protein
MRAFSGGVRWTFAEGTTGIADLLERIRTPG